MQIQSMLKFDRVNGFIDDKDYRPLTIDPRAIIWVTSSNLDPDQTEIGTDRLSFIVNTKYAEVLKLLQV